MGFWANYCQYISYQLCPTPYSAVAFAESRDSLANSIYSVGRQV